MRVGSGQTVESSLDGFCFLPYYKEPVNEHFDDSTKEVLPMNSQMKEVLKKSGNINCINVFCCHTVIKHCRTLK